MNGTLYILRGIPGCGKSTLAEELSWALSSNGAQSVPICCADDFFMKTGEYKFNPKQLGFAHASCQKKCEDSMKNSQEYDVIVANTNTTEKEMNTYLKMAEKYKYKVVSLIVENRHNGVNVHNVPEAALESMEERFTTKLR